MIFGSLFSGIEAVSVAWKEIGQAAYVSEIEKFPSAVLSHHYPNIPNYGDVMQERFLDKIGKHEIDILVGGSPCQSFSQAGRRRGTDDARGKLTPRFFEIAKQIRPRTILWENVPAVTNNAVFPTILNSLGECGYRWAYRILDAQYFGVPQHRRRLFLVANYAGRHPGEILFESSESQICLSRQQRKHVFTEDHTDLARDHGRAVAFRGRSSGTMMELGDDKAYCLRAMQGYAIPHVLDKGRIRQLTPEECEMAQGFPVGYTNIGGVSQIQSLYAGIEGVKDGLRYRAIGNSMAVPVIKWLGQRIVS